MIAATGHTWAVGAVGPGGAGHHQDPGPVGDYQLGSKSSSMLWVSCSRSVPSAFTT